MFIDNRYYTAVVYIGINEQAEYQILPTVVYPNTLTPTS